MKIGIDARLWNETGVGRYIRNLVFHLQRIDISNEYVLFVKDIPLREQFDATNPRWKVVKTDIRWHTLEEQLKFPQLLTKEKLDLVHFPYFSIPIFYKQPYVITIHDLIINHFSTGKASTLPFPLYHLKYQSYKYIIKTAARNAKKIITVSEATKAEIIQHLHSPKDKIVVTYEGVDDCLAKGGEQKAESEEQMANSFGRYVLYVGNAYPHKNLERLIEAFKKFSSEDVHLVLVGPDNYFYRKVREQSEASNLNDKVHFLGHVDDTQLRSLYQHAKALITPSLMEGFGLPGLEAMQQKCLVLAADIPVYKEIYQDGAIYFDPLSVTDIHATIRRVFEQRASLQGYVERGVTRVNAFSWEKMTRETIKVYENSISIRSS